MTARSAAPIPGQYHTLLTLLLLFSPAWAQGLLPSPTESEGISLQAEAGRRTYEQGISVSGQPIVAQTQSRVTLRGKQAACINCHRRSGLRSVEGGRIIPSITSRALLRPIDTKRWSRPAYTAASFKQALLQHVDPAGQPLDDLMPRYELSRDDIQALAAYLEYLSDNPVPGVDGERIHIATVVGAGVEPLARRSMLEVLQAYTAYKTDQWQRAEVRKIWPDEIGRYHEGEPVFRTLVQDRPRSKRMGRGVLSVERAYRKWVLHVWELKGKPETWAAQLEAYYNRQPVFAMVSGIVDGPWQPVHDFCAGFEVPCLFPNTDLPPAKEEFHNVYFNRGMALEAQVLGRHLKDLGLKDNIVQVYRAGTSGEASAESLRQSAQLEGLGIRDHIITAGEDLDPSSWKHFGARQNNAMVLWLDEKDIAALGDPPGNLGRLYLSSTLSAGEKPLSAAWKGHALFIHPYDLRAGADWLPQSALSRLRDWGIQPGDTRIQANTYTAFAVLESTVMMLGNDFSRTYLLEKIEDMLKNGMTTSLYPKGNLGPGQRFASKGAYIARQGPTGLMPVSDWIVP